MAERWASVDCAKYPSDNNCKLKLTAPENQVEHLLDAAVDHAVAHHGHPRSPELREQIRGAVEYSEG